jgi:hypothetical protein
MSTELALYEHAREALAEAVSFDEVTRIKTKAEQAKAYARIAKDRKLMADAQELVARAERKLGIMLRAAKDDGLLSQGGRPIENSNLTEPETGADAEPVFDSTPFTLADLGISKKLSSRAQQLAELDEAVFEESVTATRDRILADSAVVTGPKTIRPAPAPKPEPIKPLEPRRFHQFVVSMLALSFASDRVSSVGIWDLARTTGIIAGDDDDMEFTPEAYEAIGALIETALPALLARNTPEGSGTAREASGGQPLPGDGGIGGLQHGTQSAPHHLQALQLREAYDGEIALLGDKRGKLTMAQAEPAMRAGYAAEVPLLLLAQDLGHPLGTVKTWANRLELTSIDRMHARQQRFGVQP